MSVHIALFRGINVGGKNLISMKELVAVFSSLGYENIRTYIQSGNIVFEKNETTEQALSSDEISDAIFKDKGFRPNILILNAEQLQQYIKSNPFPAEDGKALHFFFMKNRPVSPDFERLNSLKTDSEEYRLMDRVFYLYTPEGFGRSKLAKSVENLLGVPATARNLNTVSKLISMSFK